MILVTQTKAAAMPFAPSRQALNKQIKSAQDKGTSRPAYFVDDHGKVKVNIQHPEWVKLLEKRGNPKTENTTSGKSEPAATTTPKAKRKKKTEAAAGAVTGGSTKSGGTSTDKIMESLVKKSQIAILEEQILKNEGVRYLNEQKKIKLKKAAGELIDFKLAEFLFLGYIEKLNIELLGLCKKIEPMVDNLVKKGDMKGVIALFNRNFENILTEVKKAQADDLKEWEGEQE